MYVNASRSPRFCFSCRRTRAQDFWPRLDSTLTHKHIHTHAPLTHYGDAVAHAVVRDHGTNGIDCAPECASRIDE